MAVLIAAAPALADHGRIHDRTGDVKFEPRGRIANRDITRAAWRHASGGRLVHRVSVRGNIGNPETGVGALPQLEIQVVRRGSSRSACRYTVNGRRATITASKCGTAHEKRRGGVSVEKVSRHTVRYDVAKDALGDPKAYEWRFVFPARNCRHCSYDRVPNRGLKPHDLDVEPPPPKVSPIRHVVIVYQENHSFDNVFGRLCARTGKCEGVTHGVLPDGSSIPLTRSPDIVPKVDHQTRAQNRAIHGGRMDGFAGIHGCRPDEISGLRDYGCFTQFDRDQIPNLWRLANSFAMSDRTFQLDSVPSYGAHIELVSTTLDGFTGDRPSESPRQVAPGWGCDSHLDAPWQATPGGPITRQSGRVSYGQARDDVAAIDRLCKRTTRTTAGPPAGFVDSYTMLPVHNETFVETKSWSCYLRGRVLVRFVPLTSARKRVGTRMDFGIEGRRNLVARVVVRPAAATMRAAPVCTR